MLPHAEERSRLSITLPKFTLLRGQASVGPCGQCHHQKSQAIWTGTKDFYGAVVPIALLR